MPETCDCDQLASPLIFARNALPVCENVARGQDIAAIATFPLAFGVHATAAGNAWAAWSGQHHAGHLCKPSSVLAQLLGPHSCWREGVSAVKNVLGRATRCFEKVRTSMTYAAGVRPTRLKVWAEAVARYPGLMPPNASMHHLISRAHMTA